MKKLAVIIALLGVLLYPCVCGAAPARLQGTSNSSAGTVTSLAYTSTLTPNSLLTVVVVWGDAGAGTVPTVSGTQNGSFGSAVQSYYLGGGAAEGAVLYALVNTKGAVSETINISYGASNSGIIVIIGEFSGCATSSPGDSSAQQYQGGASGGTDALSSTSISTSIDGDLIYAVTVCLQHNGDNSALSHGTNFSAATLAGSQLTPGNWVADEYLVQATHGSISGTFDLTEAGGPNFVTFAAAFKPAASTQQYTTSMSGGAVAGGSFTKKAGHVVSMAGGAVAGGSFTVVENHGTQNYTTSMSGGAVAGGSFTKVAGHVVKMAGAVAGGSFTEAATSVGWTINAGVTHQTIDGFGASCADFVSPLTTQLADFFFTGSGIGLSILRTQIMPDLASCQAWRTSESQPASECITVASGATAMTGEPLVAQQAAARGVTTIFASSWSPPGSMKANGSFYNGGSFIGNSTNYTNYAADLASYPAFMAGYGITITAISPQNEPDASEGYPSATWTAQQFHDFIPYLYSAIASSGYTPEIMFPENSSWSSTYDGFAATTMNDGSVSPDVGIMAQHGYSGDGDIVSATNYGKHVWVTEDSNQSGSSSYNGSMSDALTCAQIIHNYLAVANVNAYVWWFLTDMVGNGNGTDNAALTDINGNIPLRAYATGNWSKFVRPGWTRIDVTGGTGSQAVSAFKSSGGDFAIVAVNSGSAAGTTFSLSGGLSAASVTPYVTSATQSLAPQTPVTVSSNSFSYTLPAASVTTFYYGEVNYTVSMSGGAVAGGSFGMTTHSQSGTTYTVSMQGGAVVGGSFTESGTNVQLYRVSMSGGAVAGGHFTKVACMKWSMKGGAVAGGSFGKTVYPTQSHWRDFWHQLFQGHGHY
ncbi:MAG: glycoside hydrolase [Syntrophobacteraceae bacterium]